MHGKLLDILSYLAAGSVLMMYHALNIGLTTPMGNLQALMMSED